MNARSTFERIAHEKPRLLMLVEQDTKDQPPLGRKNIPQAEVDRRFAPLLGHIATGHVPVDEAAAPLIARALEQAWKSGTAEGEKP